MDQATENGPGAAAPAPAPLDPEEQLRQYREGVDAALGTPAADTTAAPAPAAASAPTDAEKPKGMLGKLWDYVKPLGDIGEDVKAGVRGVAQGISEMSNGAVDGMKKAASAIDPDGTTTKAGAAAQQSYRDWLESNTEKTNPLQFKQDALDKALGPQKGGVVGLVTGLAQFSTAMATVPGFAEVKGEQAAVKIGKEALRFGAAQAVGFEPHAKRLSNWIQENGPDWLRTPVSAFLAAKDDDSAAEGRVKNGLEGIVTGVVAETVMFGLKFLKAKAFGDSEGMAAAAKGAKDAASQGAPQDVVQVTQTPEGKYEVHPTGEPGHATSAQFDSPADAQNAAVSVNYAAKHAGSSGAASPDIVAKFLARAAELGENPDPRDFAELLDAHGINYKYIHAPEDAVAHVKAMADVLPNARTGPITHEETVAASQDIFRGMDGEEAVARAKQIFGDSEKLPAQITAMRTYLWQHGTHLRVLSRLADEAPENAVAQDQLAQSLQTLSDFHDHFRGTSSSIARALQAHQIPVDGSGVVEAAHAEAVGADVAKPGDEPVSPGNKPADEAKANDVSKAKAAVQAARKELDKAKQADSKYPGAGPNTETVTDPLKLAQDAEGTTRTVKSKDTAEGLKTKDFSLARAREKAVAAEKRMKQIIKRADPMDEESLDNASLRAERIKMAADEQAANPAEASTVPSEGSKNPIEELSKWLDDADSKLDKEMERAQAKAQKASVTAGMTKAEIRAMARMVHLADGDPAEALAAIKGPVASYIKAHPDVDPKSWFEKVNSYRMNAMLSGPKTTVVKAVSDIISMVQRPAEYYWAGVRSNNKALRQFGSDMLVGNWNDTVESLRAAKKALTDGANVLSPDHQVTDTPTDSKDATGFLAAMHVPTRFIMSVDEFSKQMNYRAFMRARILRTARAAGIDDPNELASRLHSDMPFAFDPSGRGVNEQALNYAKVGTYTSDMDANGYKGSKNNIGKWMQEGAQKNPMVRFVVPFVRTPVDLFRNTWERTPILNRFNAQYKADIEAGGEAAEIAKAKTAMGVAVWGTGATLAATGHLTGGGPRDPQLRALWLMHHKPYTLNIPGTDESIPYGRLNPLLTPFGIIADLHDMSGEMEGHDLSDKVSMVLASVAANLSRQTFNKGISDFTDAVAKGDPHKIKNLLIASAMTYVPSAISSINPDDTFREVRDDIDNLTARIPGFSTSLEPRRNIFGEKVMKVPGWGNRSFNPFASMDKPSSMDVSDELLQLGRGYSMPPEKMGADNNVDLTDRDRYLRPGDKARQSPYDRQLELMAHPVDGSKPLRQTLEELVKKPEWKDASDGGSYAPGGIRYIMASAEVTAAQQRAFGQVMKEYPKLASDLGYSAQLQGMSMAHGKAGEDSVIAKNSAMFATPPKPKPPKQ